MIMPKINYPVKIDFPSEKEYLEACRFLGEVSFGSTNLVGGDKHYFIDKNREGIARVNSENRTIELTDKVEPDIIDTIKYIKKHGRVKAGEDVQ